MGAAHVADVGQIHDLLAAQHRGYRQPRTNTLAAADQIGTHAVVLVAETLAGARKTRLHFVEGKQDPVLAAKSLDGLHRSEEHTSDLQSLRQLVGRLLLEK